MGLDLKLLASGFRERRDELLATASIRLERDPRLLALLSADAEPCVVRLLPDGLKVGHYEDEGLRYDTSDRYGKPLTYTTSAELRTLRAVEDLSEWNRAALAFVLNLPPDTRIILYWC